MAEKKSTVLVSACLLGVRCRYDGSSATDSELLEQLSSACVVPVCPEQLGGLPTPRAASEIEDGDGRDVLAGHSRVLNERGEDVTAAFLRGAHETLKLARQLGCSRAIMKSRSPSCGLGQIYRRGELVSGDGVTVALLQAHGIRVESR